MTEALQKFAPILDPLQLNHPGVDVAVVTLLGSLCPVTLAHVQGFMEARRLLKGEDDSLRPTQLEQFQEVVGFIALNPDEYVVPKVHGKGQCCLDFAGRKHCVELAICDHNWLALEEFEGCSLSRVRAKWPGLRFTHFSMNGADDVVRFKKWLWAGPHQRFITLGRPGYTAEVQAGMQSAGLDPDTAYFILGPELPEISSTQVRRAIATHDTRLLGEMLHRAVAQWCLEHVPTAAVPINDWMSWFLGASEKHLLRDGREGIFVGGALINSQTGQHWPVGHFEVSSVSDLRCRVSQLETYLSKPDLERQAVPLAVVDGIDIGQLQSRLMTEDSAMVQIASNFNCLEVGGRSDFPDSGNLVQNYPLDATQGPAASFGVPAACLFRTHYAFHDLATDPSSWGQTKERQIELLGSVRNFFGRCVNGKVTLTGKETALLSEQMDETVGAIRVGIHADAQVVFGRANHHGHLSLVPEPRPLIDQVLSASVNWRSLGVQPGQEQLERLTRAALRASYDGAYLAAILRKRRLLLLTLVGGGVFGNPRAMILEELASAHARWADHPASALREVRLCLYTTGETVQIVDALRLLLEERGGRHPVAEPLRAGRQIDERRQISAFLDEVARDTGKFSFGVQNTCHAMEMGAVDTLIVWDKLEVVRVRRKYAQGEEQVLHITLEDFRKRRDCGAQLEVIEKYAFLDWITQQRLDDITLKIITDGSPEGMQFCRGFGGVGGLLRWKMEFESAENESGADDTDEDF